MAEKMSEFASKFKGTGGPPGLGLGIKLLATVGAAAYGVSQSIYTGNSIDYTI
jgi:prohibitin 2